MTKVVAANTDGTLLSNSTESGNLKESQHACGGAMGGKGE